MYLLDTNIFIEILLEQEKSEDVKKFLAIHDPCELYITEFSFYSIGIILLRLRQKEIFQKFINDTFYDSEINLVHLKPLEMEQLVNIAERFNLDFDEAYQYVAAEKYGLTLVSFDTDFDRTERGRKTPAEIIQK
ncbi:MAG: PIN domain-containing protein [Candidatus Kuenenia sp.]|nr:PIN domain-containing protein [Candidatus Kuenenia sp.]